MLFHNGFIAILVCTDLLKMLIKCVVAFFGARPGAGVPEAAYVRHSFSFDVYGQSGFLGGPSGMASAL